MHHPPAPIICEGERLFDAGKRNHAEGVKQSDIYGGRPDEILKPNGARPELPRGLRQRPSRGPQGAEHEQAPDHEPKEKSDLPEVAQLNVRQALIAEPEPAVPDIAHDAEVIADQRVRDDGKVTQNSRSTRNACPFASWPPAIAGARNRPAPIHDTPIQTIGV